MTLSYAEIFESFPPDLRLPIARLVDTLKEEFRVTRSDFEDLKGIVRDLAEAQKRTEGVVEELAQAQKRTEGVVEELAQAQKRTEARLERLEGVVEELAQAQKRTEGVVEELAQAQKRTEGAVEELAQAQKRTEARLERLEGVVEELAQAQKRTEGAVEELAQAQKRTEARLERLEGAVEELAQAQKRTEGAVEELAQAQKRTEGAVEELAQAQKQTEDEFSRFRRDFVSQIGGLGARWGLQTEGAFRQGMRSILHEVGFATERFLQYDSEGEVFGDPDQVELDVVVKNGKVIVVEIKSSLSRADVNYFERKVAFYTRRTGRRVDRKLMVTPYADDRAKERASQLGIEIYTDLTALQ